MTEKTLEDYSGQYMFDQCHYLDGEMFMRCLSDSYFYPGVAIEYDDPSGQKIPLVCFKVAMSRLPEGSVCPVKVKINWKRLEDIDEDVAVQALRKTLN